MNSHGDHSELWDYVEGLQAQVHDLTDRILVLEHQTPEVRQLQMEADTSQHIAEALQILRRAVGLQPAADGTDTGEKQ